MTQTITKKLLTTAELRRRLETEGTWGAAHIERLSGVAPLVRQGNHILWDADDFNAIAAGLARHFKALIGGDNPEPLDGLGFTPRTKACLNAEKIGTVADLLRWSENELLRTPNLGRKSLYEIKDALATRGLHLRA